MPSKVAGVALATAGAYAASQAFLAPTAPVTQPSTGRHLRQATETSGAASCAGAGALAVGVAGVAVAANQKRVSRRCQARGSSRFSWLRFELGS